MSDVVKGFLIVLLVTVLSTVVFVLLNLATGGPVDWLVAILIGAIFGLLYGLEAGILVIYDLSSPKGWLEVVIDSDLEFAKYSLGLRDRKHSLSVLSAIPLAMKAVMPVGLSICHEAPVVSAITCCKPMARSTWEAQANTRKCICCRHVSSARCFCQSIW